MWMAAIYRRLPSHSANIGQPLPPNTAHLLSLPHPTLQSSLEGICVVRSTCVMLSQQSTVGLSSHLKLVGWVQPQLNLAEKVKNYPSVL